MEYSDIIAQLPYSSPFLFVDEILDINENGVHGAFTFQADLDFYAGHFVDHPVTPGVILTECCAQIGLVCLGIFLNSENIGPSQSLMVALSSAEMEYLLPVYPGQKVEVRSKKIYYRFNKLKCDVKMYNAEGKLVCKGVLSGMAKEVDDE